MKLKQNKLIYILILVILLVLSIVVINVFYKSNEDSDEDSNVNTNKYVVEEKKISNIKFYNFKYIYDGINTIVTVDIKNENNNTVILNQFLVKIYDEDKNIIGEFEPECSDDIVHNGIIKDFQFMLQKDLRHAYFLEIELPNLIVIEQ